MSAEVGGVYLGVHLDSKPAFQQADDVRDQMERAFNKVAKKIDDAFKRGLSLKALAKFSKKCIDLGSDLAEVQNVVDVTFTSMSGKINDFARNAAQQFGLSEIMAKRYSGTFGAMAKAFGFAEGEAAEMSTTLAGLAGDVASFYNIDQDAAYTKLKAVFSGETESLKDLGIVMTQTALDQYALQHGFGTTTAKMSEQQKVALRYQFILSKLSNVSGDFARTSNGWANQVRILKLQFESLCSVIGSVLIAALSPAIRGLNAFMGALVKAANTFKSFVFSLFGKQSEDMTAGAGASMAALGDSVEDAMGGAEDAASSASDGLSGVGDSAKGAARDAKQAAKEMQRSLAGFDVVNKLGDNDSGNSGGGSGGPGGGSGSGSGAGGSGVSGALGDTSSALKNTAYDVGSDGGPLDKLTEKLKALKDLFVGGFWKGFGDTEVLQSIKDNLGRIGDSLTDIFNDKRVQGAAENYLNTLSESLGQRAGAFASIGATVADNLTGGAAKFLEQNKERVTGFIVRMFDISAETERIKGDFAQAVAEIFSVFRSDDAKQATGDLVSIVWENLSGMAELGAKASRDTLNALTQPFIDNKDKLKEALEKTLGPARKVLDGAVTFVQESWDSIQKLYDEHIHPLVKSLTDGVSEIFGTLLDGYNKHVAPVLDKLADKAVEVWEKHLSPMVTSLTDALGAVVDLLKTCWEQVLKPLLNWIADKVMPVLAPVVELIGTDLLDAVAKTADKIKTFSDWVKTAADVLSNLIESVPDLGAIRDKITESLGAFTVKISAFFSDKKEELTSKWNDLTANVKDKTAELRAKIATSWSDLKGKWNDITDNIRDKTADLKARVATSWSDLKSKWHGITENIKDKTADMKARVATSWSELKGKWSSLMGKFKDKTVSIKLKIAATVNNLKSWFNRNVISRVNNAIHRIPLLKNVSIPKLAQGGYVRKNTPQLAMIGDNRHQGEVVAPERKLLEMAREAASSAGGSDPRIYALLLELVTMLKTMPVYRIDEESLRKYFIRQTNRNTYATGKCELKV